MALAGHAATVRIRTSTGKGSGSDNIDGCNQASLSRVRDELEVTNFEDGADKEFILGLAGGEVTGSGQYESADTAYGRLVTAFGDGTDVFVIILWDGTNGHEAPGKVTKLDISAGVGGTVDCSWTVRLSGAVIAAA